MLWNWFGLRIIIEKWQNFFIDILSKFFFGGFGCNNYSRETTIQRRKLLIPFFLVDVHYLNCCRTKYHMCSIITRGLYIFLPHLWWWAYSMQFSCKECQDTLEALEDVPLGFFTFNLFTVASLFLHSATNIQGRKLWIIRTFWVRKLIKGGKETNRGNMVLEYSQLQNKIQQLQWQQKQYRIHIVLDLWQRSQLLDQPNWKNLQIGSWHTWLLEMSKTFEFYSLFGCFWVQKGNLKLFETKKKK